ncbi:MAG TPA: bifunctional 4-hydroxy-2-oxoglutarate aldolase/2-dehydro-3-deoxy-phosphogluconate aldolase, partial [Solirubrobacteraceae bacterium]|nr:bifunctional 4-hydroxy-2-oxoglutarate aldolase/2-dehydro-3-deoxy-phosphogluconate aldolase [Solirubrobacteraceae bacterium]
MPSVPDRPPITPQLAESGVVAILRGSSDRHLEAVARTLGEAGVTCLELTLTTPGAIDALARVRGELPAEVALGMGSVIDAGQAAACLDAGADFLVSPGVCAEVAVYALERGVACYPGGWTPTELLECWRLGAPAVKLFPAASGGPRHLKDVRAPLPHI